MANSMHAPRDFVLSLLIPAIVGGAISLLIDWEFWHGVAFTISLIGLAYTVSVWLGAEPWLRLEAPWIGVPILIVLALVLWWGHFGLDEVRPVTLMIQVATAGPFVALTVCSLLRLH